MSGLIMAGGGTPRQSEAVDAAFRQLVRGPRLLYVPFARDDEPEIRVKELQASFAPETDRIEVWDDPHRLPRPLPAYDAVYIDGGNTFDLMAAVRSADLGPVMADYLAAGGLIYGMSAGAILFGASITPAAFFDPNDAGLTDFSGLGQLGGASIWPHYLPGYDGELRALAAREGHDVIGVAEEAAVHVLDGQFTALGPGAVLRFRPGDDDPEPIGPAGLSWT
jgi:dipeptidase E